MKKRVISLLLVAAMTVGLVACGSSSGDGKKSSASSDEKILSVQTGPDPETVDPALNSAIDGGEMILHAFEGLLKLDENGDPEAGQAEKWEVSDDGLTYTFHLRDGLKWSDGSDLTAEDFVYSWQRVCDPNVAAPYASTVLGMVEGFDEAAAGDIEKLGVEAKDDKTFVVHLANPCPYFESIAAFATLNPVQKATIEANGDAWATEADTYISNGPFYVAEWVPGSYVLMKKNTNYWDADSIKLDGIKFNLIEDANAAYSAYQTGECQMIKDVPTEEIPSLKDNDEFHVEPIIGTYYLSLNLQKEPFNNKQVRQALSLAIDRDYVANTLMQGTYSPAGNLVGPGWKDTDGSDFSENANGGKEYISTTDYDANLQKAKDLLKEAGYADGKGIPKITYSTNDLGYHKVVAEYLQKAWGELGIDVDVEIVEWASFTPMRRNGDYMSSRNGWVGDYSDPSNILELFTTDNGNNDGKYSNPEFDAVIEKSRTTTDAAERSAALHEAEDMLMDDAACIPVAYYNDFYLMSDKVTGAWHASNGYWYFMYADITE
ncbi:MAG: peptide ABC transporter substrate-binding protein [Lachnospiraceae bacterium]|nr:peptide ABC transporter substrate-binding protein [Lachnospiraceae bacterium]